MQAGKNMTESSQAKEKVLLDLDQVNNSQRLGSRTTHEEDAKGSASLPGRPAREPSSAYRQCAISSKDADRHASKPASSATVCSSLMTSCTSPHRESTTHLEGCNAAFASGEVGRSTSCSFPLQLLLLKSGSVIQVTPARLNPSSRRRVLSLSFLSWCCELA